MPQSDRTCLIHGDFRIDNVLLDRQDPAVIRAVVDWELATLGDPLADVALMCVYREPALDLVLDLPAAWASMRLPSPDDLAQRYAQTTGRPLDNWDFHIGLAFLKLAVIAAGIDYRERLNTQGTAAGGAGDAVAPLVAAGLRRLT